MRVCFSSDTSFGPLEARNSLLHIYEELRELHLAGLDSAVNKPHDAVRLLLETASGSADPPSSSTAANDGLVRDLKRSNRRFLCSAGGASPVSAAHKSWPAPHQGQAIYL